MFIRHNTIASNIHRMYSQNISSMAKSAERLSSGYRINRAGDDAAGLAISEKMRAQIRGLNMASKNCMDAVSLIQTAEGALQEVHSMLQRMNELAVQAASDTNVTIDRNALQLEFENLQEEIDQIARTTKFNDTLLLIGNDSPVKKVIPGEGVINVDPAVTSLVMGDMIVSGAAEGTVVSVVTGAAAGAPAATGEWDENGNFTLTLSAAAGQTIDQSMVDLAIENASGTVPNGAEDFNISLGTWSYTAAGNTVAGEKIGSVTLVNPEKEQINPNIGYAVIDLMINDTDTVKLYCQGNVGKDIMFTFRQGIDRPVGGGVSFHVNSWWLPDGTLQADIVIQGNAEFGQDSIDHILSVADQAPVSQKPADIDSSIYKIWFDRPYKTTKPSNGKLQPQIVTLEPREQIVEEEPEAEPGVIIIQSGPEEGQILPINIVSMDTKGLGITKEQANISTREGASNAITITRDAINKVSTQRAYLGAMQNRLEHRINSLDNISENLVAAESRIRDADMAKEMSNFTKMQILTQVATAMIAQANAIPQNILQLLG